jgi:type IV pilus assembly protein PilE
MHYKARKLNGFTLVELLIAMAIIGILATIAVPALSDHLVRGKLLEATTALSDGRVKMEQFFQDNKTYAGGPAPQQTDNFTFAVANDTATTFTITATGKAGTAVSAFIYTIDETNARTTVSVKSGWIRDGDPPAPWAPPKPCWITKSKGVC